MRKTWLLAGALAGLALAPLGPEAGAGEPLPVYQERINFGAPVRMPYTDPGQLGGPGEPSIKVDSAGTIYTAGVCCVVRAAPAWYSRDGGKTFRNLPSPAGARETAVGAEGDFAVDDADSLYFADTWIPSIFLTKWSGHGDIWEYTNDTVTVLPGFDDRPWLAYAHGTLYMYVNHVTHVEVWRSTDGGHTWQSSLRTSTPGGGQRYWTGHVATDRRTGSVYLFGSRCSASPSDLCAAYSHDGGTTWAETRPALSPPRGSVAPFMVSADVDAAGNVYGTYATADGSGCDVYLGVSTDRAKTWRQFKVNPAAGCSTFPWVAAGDDGRVALSWYYNPSKKHQDSVPAGSEWKVQAAVVTGATTDTPTVTYGTLNQVIHRGGLGRTLWDYQQVAVGPDGRFHIAFAEDAAAPCSGPGPGSIAGYTKKCTAWVAQDAGPRAVPHAADATSVDALTATGGSGSIEVGGAATFGRAAPVQVANDTDTLPWPPGLDVGSATIVRTSAGSDDLVLALKVPGLPEAIDTVGARYEWGLRVPCPSEVCIPEYGMHTLVMQPRPWRFELCEVSSGRCTRVRGDADAGGDRVVARVPLKLLGALPGTQLGSWNPRSVLPNGTAVDESTITGPYTVPGASVKLSVTDAGGNEVASATGALSADLGSFSAALDGLAAGTYTVTARACFATNCATASRAGVVVT